MERSTGPKPKLPYLHPPFLPETEEPVTTEPEILAEESKSPPAASVGRVVNPVKLASMDFREMVRQQVLNHKMKMAKSPAGSKKPFGTQM